MAPGGEPAPAKYRRSRLPAHYLLKIDSFDVLSKTKKYESTVFDVGGYKWKLSLYPQGDEEAGVSEHISLYLSIVGPPPEKTVHTNCRLFVRAVESRKWTRYQYLTIGDAAGAVTSFGHSKRQPDRPNLRFGFRQFLSLKEFKDPSNGYLDERGSCAFGAEVFVLPSAWPKVEHFALTRYAARTQSTFPFWFERWSTLGTEARVDEFRFGGRRWNLLVYPKGYGSNRDKSLSVYIKALDLAKNTKVYAEFSVRVLDQREEVRKRQHRERTLDLWLSEESCSKGWGAFMPLDDLRPRGTEFGQKFVRNDTLVAEVEMIALSNAVAVPE